jgi:Na+(H+)/acetate symporter ActP
MADLTQYPVNKAVDAVAAASILGTVVGWLPAIASAISAIYFAVQIYESHTFTHWNDVRKARKKARKIARLKAKLAQVEGASQE